MPSQSPSTQTLDLSQIDIKDLSLPQIEERLFKEFGIKVYGKKDQKLELLKKCISRPPLNINLDFGDGPRQRAEKRKVFKVEDNSLWQPIKDLKTRDIPISFDLDVITTFLRDSVVKVNGKNIKRSIKKAKVEGLRMYISRRILSVKFVRTNTMLILDGQCYASMEQETR